MTAIVHYQIATYSGDIQVSFDDENLDDEQVVGLAKAKLRRKVGHIPIGAQSFKVISRNRGEG